jgi:hypothetical protein
MSVPPINDGRATARTRFRIFTGRTHAGRRWTGRTFGALVAAAALAALGVTAGTGSASAATAQPAGPTITGVNWHQLTLINGWVSGQSQEPGDGIPAWTVRNGVVYLTGSVMQTSGTGNEFAVLPPAARPSRVLYMTVKVAGQGASGWIIIDPSGAMYATADPYSEVSPPDSMAAAGDIVISPDGRLYSDSFPLSESEAYTSLAGISYPLGS